MTGVIVDTDILSAFGKVKKLDLLEQLFEEILIVPAVFEELLEAQRLGFDFVEDILNSAELVTLTNDLVEKVKGSVKLYPQLGKGEIETIILAKEKGFVVLTNDKLAKRICHEESIDFLDLEEILRAVKIKEILKIDQLRGLIEAIEKEDRTKIKAKEQILSD